MTFIPREWHFGKSLYRLEQPDLLSVKLRGGGSLDEVRRVVGFYAELAAVHPFFVLSDMDEADRLDDEARRYIDEHVQPAWILGFIYVNARLLHRSTAMGILLVYELTQKEAHPWRKKIHFVSTRDEGLALYGRLRAPPGPPAPS